MSLGESIFLQREIQEIEFLQSTLINMSFFAGGGLDPEETTEYLHTLYALLEKQHIVYTRLCLMSDDEEAQSLRTDLENAATMLGKPNDVSLHEFYQQMKEEVKLELGLDNYDPT